MGILTGGVGVSLIPLPSLRTLPSIVLLCPAWIQGVLPCLIVPYFVVFDCCLLNGCSFLRRKELGLCKRGDRGYQGEVKRGKIVLRMCCVREEAIFSERNHLIFKWDKIYDIY